MAVWHCSCSVSSVMNTLHLKLASGCAALWAVGVLGMTVARGVFERCPGAASFDLFAALSIVGGATYCLMGALAIFGSDPAK